MTVSTEISSNEYTGNGVTTDFDYKFRIFKASDLSVTTSDADGDNVVTLRLGTDYTVTGVNKSAGGKVILIKPLADKHQISISRVIPIVQETSFRNQGKFLAETHEDAFDYLTMLIQRIWGSLGSLYLKRPNILANWFDAKGYRIANLGKPKRDSDAVDLGTLKDEIEGVNSTILKNEKRLLRVDDMDISALPKANDRAGNVLTFDKDGKPIVVAPSSGSAVDVLNQLASGDGSLIGVGNQTLKDKFGEIATIVDYGAKSIIGFDNVDYINAMQAERDIVIPRGVFEIASNITISRNVEFLNGAILKPLLGVVCTIEHDVIASNQLIFDLSEGGTVLLAGNANQYGLQEIKPYWFDIEKIGYSQIIRGRGAGLKAINNKAKMNYNHIDGFRAAENTAELIESTILGCFSGAGLVKGSLSTALGYGALRGKEKPGRGEFEEVTAINTTAAGQGALQDGATHLGTVAVGSGAGKEVRNSLHSVFIGNNVARLAYNIAYSDFIGSGAGYYWGSVGDVADNQYNVLFGYNTANSVKTGTRSTIIGSRAGAYSETCNSNTWIGYLTGVDSATYKDVSNSICIGDAARTRFNYTITIGDNITNAVEGRTHIGNDKTTSCLIRGIHELTTASSANVFVDPAGVLRRSTSSRKFKKHIREYELEWAYKVLEFKPIIYKPTEGAVNPDWTYYGYIAEQVAKIDPRYAQIHESFITNEQGELVGTGEFNVGGVMYDRIVVAQGVIIKDLLTRLDALEKLESDRAAKLEEDIKKAKEKAKRERKMKKEFGVPEDHTLY